MHKKYQKHNQFITRGKLSLILSCLLLVAVCVSTTPASATAFISRSSGRNASAFAAAAPKNFHVYLPFLFSGDVAGGGEPPSTSTPNPSPTTTERAATSTPNPSATPTHRAATSTPNPSATPTRRVVTSTPNPSPTATLRAATSTPKPTATATLPAATQTPNPTSVPGAGKVYYVATNGSDSNTGTASSPWRTIQKGLTTVQAGDTLYIRSGVYVQTAPLKLSNSGSSAAGKMITISTAPGEPSLAVISGDTNGDGQGDVPAKGTYTGLVEIRGSYVLFQNLEVAYSGGYTLNNTGTHNVLSGLNVHHAFLSGIQIGSGDNVIEKNTVWRSAESNYCGGSVGRLCNGNWGAGIAWGDAHSVTAPGSAPRTIVRNNTVYNNSGEGIICMHTDYATVDSNVVYDNWALQIDLDQCSYSAIQKNLVYATNNPSWWRRSTGPGTGIMLSNEGIAGSGGATYPAGHDRKVINNIMVGNGSNFYFWKASLATSALINDLIANNTLVEAQGGSATGLKIDAASHSNTRIYNNLVVQSSGTIAYAGSTGGLTFGNNLWSKTPPSNMSSASDVIGNPLLVNPSQPPTPGSVLADWYKIKDSTSPAIGRGFSLTDVAVDFWNRLRSSKPDIGAHQYSQ